MQLRKPHESRKEMERMIDSCKLDRLIRRVWRGREGKS